MDQPTLTEWQAGEFARMYVRLTEALMREGVPEAAARGEARMTATDWLMDALKGGELDADGTCPLCGRTREDEAE